MGKKYKKEREKRYDVNGSSELGVSIELKVAHHGSQFGLFEVS